MYYWKSLFPVWLPYSDKMPLELIFAIASWCRDTGTHPAVEFGGAGQQGSCIILRPVCMQAAKNTFDSKVLPSTAE